MPVVSGAVVPLAVSAAKLAASLPPLPFDAALRLEKQPHPFSATAEPLGLLPLKLGAAPQSLLLHAGAPPVPSPSSVLLSAFARQAIPKHTRRQRIARREEHCATKYVATSLGATQGLLKKRKSWKLTFSWF